MNKMMLMVTLLLGASAVAQSTANQYWISTTGSDSNPGTQTQPWATIAHASAALTLGTSGTIVHVASGTYDGCIVTSRSGTATQRITYISDTQYAAHLTCTAGGTSGQSTDSTIWDARGGYIDIVGFDIDGGNVQGRNRIGIYLNNTQGHDNVLKNKIHGLEGCSSSASATGTTEVAAYTPYNTYDRNLMYNIGNTCVAQGFNSGGVAGEGVYISNPYDVVTNNIFHDISSAGASSGNAVWMNHCGVSHETIANNTMFNNGSGVAIDWAACSGPYAQPKADYITIANNIIVNNRAWGIVEHDYGCLFGTCQGVIGANNYYQNNLVYGNAGQQGGNTGVCSKIGDTLYNIVVFTGHCATNSLSVNPALGTLFINWQLDGSGDYHDKIGSPAIDAGEGIGGNSFVAPTIDFDGNTRSLGAGSIGAYEYVLAPNPPTALTVKVN